MPDIPAKIVKAGLIIFAPVLPLAALLIATNEPFFLYGFLFSISVGPTMMLGGILYSLAVDG